MSLVFVPILAQVLSASVGDRAELRYVAEGQQDRLEFENRAYATAGIRFPFVGLSLTYSPSILISPLESSDRTTYILHDLSGAIDTGAGLVLYQSRTSTITAGVLAAYTQTNTRRQVLGAPGPPSSPAAPPDDPLDPGTVPDPSPTSPVAVDVAAEDFTAHIATGGAAINGVHLLTRRSAFSELAMYTVSTGIGERSRRRYPLTHGPSAALGYAYRLTPRDLLTTTVNGSLAIVPSLESRVWIGTVSERWDHRFSRRTIGDVTAGISYTYVDANGTARDAEGIYPNSMAGITHTTRVARGRLDLRLEVSYAPALDRTRFVFDPRFNVTGSAGWTRRRLSLYTTVQTSISLTPEDEGSLQTVSAAAGLQYDLGAGFTFDSGVRGAWQTYEGFEVVPPAWAVFVGIAWTHALL